MLYYMRYTYLYLLHFIIFTLPKLEAIKSSEWPKCMICVAYKLYYLKDYS